MTATETPTKFVSVTDTAKLIRTALKKAHPGTKFSVRSSKYAGGASINVGWTDGPTEAQVKEITDHYEGATFDGMQDLKEYRSRMVDGVQIHYGADFIFENRTVSDEAVAGAIYAGLVKLTRIGAGFTCDHCLNHLTGAAFTAQEPDEHGRRIFACSPRHAAERLLRQVEVV